MLAQAIISDVGPTKKNRAAVELARLRSEKLTPEERSDIASMGGVARAAQISEERQREISSAAGKARLKKIPAKKRSQIAKKGAEARWGKKGK